MRTPLETSENLEIVIPKGGVCPWNLLFPSYCTKADPSLLLGMTTKCD
jgi:hypothetical protein